MRLISFTVHVNLLAAIGLGLACEGLFDLTYLQAFLVGFVPFVIFTSGEIAWAYYHPDTWAGKMLRKDIEV